MGVRRLGAPVGVGKGYTFGGPQGTVYPVLDVIREASILREPDPVILGPLKVSEDVTGGIEMTLRWVV